MKLPPDISATLVDPRIHHLGKIPENRPLDACSEPITSHVFEFRITRHDLNPTWGLRDERKPTKEEDHAWERLAALPMIGTGRDRSYNARGEPYVTVAVLEALELRDRIRIADGRSWLDWFDQAGDDALGAIAETIANQEGDRDYGFALIGGAAIYFSDLDVHPAFRGQHLGARLLAHATWHLVDSSCVGLLRAYPKDSAFEPDRPLRERPEPIDQTGRDALVRYYARVGYKPWERGSNLMYFLGDEQSPWHRF